MFQNIFIAIAIASVLFLAYLFLRAYKPGWVGAGSSTIRRIEEETFAEPRAAAAGPVLPTAINTPIPPVPAPAPEIKEDPPTEPRTISPGGPNAPAAAPAETAIPTLSPDAKPLDPYDDSNMEAPIHDSLRHPERSFGPGVDNSGMNRLATSGVGSVSAMSRESPFSPEFAQNGGSFMGSVFANDLTRDDRFAEA